MSAATRHTPLAAAKKTRTQIVALDASPRVSGGLGILFLAPATVLTLLRSRHPDRPTAAQSRPSAYT